MKKSDIKHIKRFYSCGGLTTVETESGVWVARHMKGINRRVIEWIREWDTPDNALQERVIIKISSKQVYAPLRAVLKQYSWMFNDPLSWRHSSNGVCGVYMPISEQALQAVDRKHPYKIV